MSYPLGVRSPLHRIVAASLALLLALLLRPSVGGCVTGAAACVPKSCCATSPSTEAQLRQRMPCCKTSPCTDAKTTTAERHDPPQLQTPLIAAAPSIAAPSVHDRLLPRAVPTPPVPIYLRLRSLLL
jgi:hypothetical protein